MVFVHSILHEKKTSRPHSSLLSRTSHTIHHPQHTSYGSKQATSLAVDVLRDTQSHHSPSHIPISVFGKTKRSDYVPP